MQKVRAERSIFRSLSICTTDNRFPNFILVVRADLKNGAGLVSAASVYWDASRDGLCKVMWENSKMHCTVTVYRTSVNVKAQQLLETYGPELLVKLIT